MEMGVREIRGKIFYDVKSASFEYLLRVFSFLLLNARG